MTTTLRNYFENPVEASPLDNQMYTPMQLAEMRAEATNERMDRMSSLGRGIARGLHKTPAGLADAMGQVVEASQEHSLPIGAGIEDAFISRMHNAERDKKLQYGPTQERSGSDALFNWAKQQRAVADTYHTVDEPKDYEQVHDASSLGNYIAGMAGENIPNIIPQMAIGIPARVAMSGLAAPNLVKNISAAAIGAYPSLMGEGVGALREDPEIMKNTAPAERLSASIKYGLVTAPLEVLGEVVGATRLVGAGKAVKTIFSDGVKNGLKSGAKHLAMAPIEAAVLEGGVEALEQKIQQMMQTRYNPERDTTHDAHDLKESFFGGWAAGGGHSVVGRGADVAWSTGRDGIRAAADGLGKVSDKLQSAMDKLRSPNNLPADLTNSDDQTVVDWSVNDDAKRNESAATLADSILSNETAPNHLRESANKFAQSIKEGSSDAWTHIRDGLDLEKRFATGKTGVGHFIDAAKKTWAEVKPGSEKANVEASDNDQLSYQAFRSNLDENSHTAKDQELSSRLYSTVKQAIQDDNWHELPLHRLEDEFGSTKKVASAISELRDNLVRDPNNKIEPDIGFSRRLEARMLDGQEGEQARMDVLFAYGKSYIGKKRTDPGEGVKDGNANYKRRLAARGIADFLVNLSDRTPAQKAVFAKEMRAEFGANTDKVLQAFSAKSSPITEGDLEDTSDVNKVGESEGFAPSISETAPPTQRFIGQHTQNALQSEVGNESDMKFHGGMWDLGHGTAGAAIQARMQDTMRTLSKDGNDVTLLKPLEYAEKAGIDPVKIAESLKVPVSALANHPSRMMMVERAGQTGLSNIGDSITNEQIGNLAKNTTDKQANYLSKLITPDEASAVHAALELKNGGEQRKALEALGLPNAVKVTNFLKDGVVQNKLHNNLNHGGNGQFTVTMNDPEGVAKNVDKAKANGTYSAEREAAGEYAVKHVVSSSELIAEMRSRVDSRDNGGSALANFNAGIAMILANKDVEGIAVHDIWGREQATHTGVSRSAREAKKAVTAQTATQEVQQLVETAKPPGFAKNKEAAKANGADLVFAPTGVDGYAARLANAAKSAGKLADPDSNDNLSGKVVYVSVPGASRGFTGMAQFTEDVRKLLSRGAIIRTDNNENASRSHNAPGEGALRNSLAFGNYVVTERGLYTEWRANLPRNQQTTTAQTATASEVTAVKSDTVEQTVAPVAGSTLTPEETARRAKNAARQQSNTTALGALGPFFKIQPDLILGKAVAAAQKGDIREDELKQAEITLTIRERHLEEAQAALAADNGENEDALNEALDVAEKNFDEAQHDFNQLEDLRKMYDREVDNGNDPGEQAVTNNDSSTGIDNSVTGPSLTVRNFGDDGAPLHPHGATERALRGDTNTIKHHGVTLNLRNGVSAKHLTGEMKKVLRLIHKAKGLVKIHTGTLDVAADYIARAAAANKDNNVAARDALLLTAQHRLHAALTDEANVLGYAGDGSVSAERQALNDEAAKTSRVAAEYEANKDDVASIAQGYAVGERVEKGVKRTASYVDRVLPIVEKELAGVNENTTDVEELKYIKGLKEELAELKAIPKKRHASSTLKDFAATLPNKTTMQIKRDGVNRARGIAIMEALPELTPQQARLLVNMKHENDAAREELTKRIEQKKVDANTTAKEGVIANMPTATARKARITISKLQTLIAANEASNNEEANPELRRQLQELIAASTETTTSVSKEVSAVDGAKAVVAKNAETKQTTEANKQAAETAAENDAAIAKEAASVVAEHVARVAEMNTAVDEIVTEVEKSIPKKTRKKKAKAVTKKVTEESTDTETPAAAAQETASEAITPEVSHLRNTAKALKEAFNTLHDALRNGELNKPQLVAQLRDALKHFRSAVGVGIANIQRFVQQAIKQYQIAKQFSKDAATKQAFALRNKLRRGVVRDSSEPTTDDTTPKTSELATRILDKFTDKSELKIPPHSASAELFLEKNGLSISEGIQKLTPVEQHALAAISRSLSEIYPSVTIEHVVAVSKHNPYEGSVISSYGILMINKKHIDNIVNNGVISPMLSLTLHHEIVHLADAIGRSSKGVSVDASNFNPRLRTDFAKGLGYVPVGDLSKEASRIARSFINRQLYTYPALDQATLVRPFSYPSEIVAQSVAYYNTRPEELEALSPTLYAFGKSIAEAIASGDRVKVYEAISGLSAIEQTPSSTNEIDTGDFKFTLRPEAHMFAGLTLPDIHIGKATGREWADAILGLDEFLENIKSVGAETKDVLRSVQKAIKEKDIAQLKKAAKHLLNAGGLILGTVGRVVERIVHALLYIPNVRTISNVAQYASIAYTLFGLTKFNAESTAIHNDLGKPGFAATHDSPIRHEGLFDWRKYTGTGEGNLDKGSEYDWNSDKAAYFGAGSYFSTDEGVHGFYKDGFSAKTASSIVSRDQLLAKLDEAKGSLKDLQRTIARNVKLLDDDKSSTDEAFLAKTDIHRSQLVSRTDKYRVWEKQGIVDIAALEEKVANHNDGGVYRGRISPTYHVSVNATPDEIFEWEHQLRYQIKANKGMAEKMTRLQSLVKKLGDKADTQFRFFANDIHTGANFRVLTSLNKMLKSIVNDKAVVSDSALPGPNLLNKLKGALRNMIEPSVSESIYPTGEQLYETLAQALGTQRQASNIMQEAGFVGLKYNGVNGENYNYVIFDDKRVTTNAVQFNKEGSFPNGTGVTQADMTAARAYMDKVLGPQVQLHLAATLGGNSASWQRVGSDTIIRIAAAALNPQSKVHHEAMHEFFQRLLDAHPEAAATLQKAASSASVVRQIEQFFHNDANYAAIKAALADPHERVAYMYQLWAAGAINLGPKTQGIFAKIAAVFRKITGLLSDSQHAEALLQHFHDGEMSNQSDVARVLANSPHHVKAYLDAMAKVSNPTYTKARELLITSQNELIDSGNKSLEKIGRLFSNETGHVDKDIGFLSAKTQKANQMTGRLWNAIRKLDTSDMAAVLEGLQTGVTSNDPKIEAAQTRIRKELDDIHAYLVAAKVKVNKIANYFPRAWNADVIAANKTEFAALLIKDGNISQNTADAIINTLIASRGADPLTESEYRVGYSPFMAAANHRTLDFIKSPEFAKFQQKDLVSIMTTYIAHATHRAEYTRRMGEDDIELRAMLKEAPSEVVGAEWATATQAAEATLATTRAPLDAAVKAGTLDYEGFKKEMIKAGYPLGEVEMKHISDLLTPAAKKLFDGFRPQLRRAQRSIMSMEGTLGADINPKLRGVIAGLMVYENMRHLTLSLFAQVIDPLGVMIRGSDGVHAWDTFKRGIQGTIAGWKGTPIEDHMHELAIKLGIIDAGNFINSHGNTYSSVFMGKKAKWFNDHLFRVNGVEGFSQGTRVGAMVAAIDFIKAHSDPKLRNKHSDRYMEELGLPKTGANVVGGELDYNDKAIQDAIFRWVDGAIIRPNASMRPSWASDPHYALLFHMKQFVYASQKVLLERIASEYKHGNSDPGLTMLVTFVPAMLVADCLRGLLANGGQEPPWKKNWKASDYLIDAVQRAGLFGVPQLALDTAKWGPAELTGPFGEQVWHGVKTFEKDIARDHKLDERAARTHRSRDQQKADDYNGVKEASKKVAWDAVPLLSSVKQGLRKNIVEPMMN